MTVKELIKMLKVLDPNAEVEVANAAIVADMRDGWRWEKGGTRTLWKSSVKEVEDEHGKKVVLG